MPNLIIIYQDDRIIDQTNEHGQVTAFYKIDNEIPWNTIKRDLGTIRDRLNHGENAKGNGQVTPTDGN